MLKYADYDIVFQEIPDEVTLAINLSNCPHRCPGCHSPYLQGNTGKELNRTTLSGLLRVYGKSVTCVCFMGGDADPGEVCALASFVREEWNGKIKTAWYSGNDTLKDETSTRCFDFIKLGAYVEALGGLNRTTTNQRLYRIDNGNLEDITRQMQRKPM